MMILKDGLHIRGIEIQTTADEDRQARSVLLETIMAVHKAGRKGEPVLTFSQAHNLWVQLCNIIKVDV